MTSEDVRKLFDLVEKYERRVTKNRATFKVEVHVNLADMAIVLAMARSWLTHVARGMETKP
jgi:hypothetical protein